MRLNEAIKKDLLARVPNFDDWKYQQTPEYAAERKKEKEREEAEAFERERQERRDFYENISREQADKIWNSSPLDYEKFDYMFYYAWDGFPEETLTYWATTLKDEAFRILDKPKKEVMYRAKRLVAIIVGDLTRGNKALAILAKSPIQEIRSLAQSVRSDRRKLRKFKTEGLMRESMDRSILSKIPDFDEWREAGGSMKEYYKQKLEKKYPGSRIYKMTDIGPHKDHVEVFKWALSQEPNKTPDGAIWDEEVAKKMSDIVGRTKFMTYTRVYYQQDDTKYPDVEEQYYKDGKFYRDDPFRGRGY